MAEMAADPRIDSYIARQADFARPILEHLRSAVHSACPEAEETLKWGMPQFLYKKQMLAGMAAFKAHATFGFRRSKEVLGETGAKREAMGQFGRLASLSDLPPEEALNALIRKAMALIDSGPRPARGKAAPKAEPETPPELAAALDCNLAARATFDGFPPGCRREYVEWVIEAKRPETRDRRIAQAVEWMAEGSGGTGNTRNAESFDNEQVKHAPGMFQDCRGQSDLLMVRQAHQLIRMSGRG